MTKITLEASVWGLTCTTFVTCSTKCTVEHNYFLPQRQCEIFFIDKLSLWLRIIQHGQNFSHPRPQRDEVGLELSNVDYWSGSCCNSNSSELGVIHVACTIRIPLGANRFLFWRKAIHSGSGFKFGPVWPLFCPPVFVNLKTIVTTWQRANFCCHFYITLKVSYFVLKEKSYERKSEHSWYNLLISRPFPDFIS